MGIFGGAPLLVLQARRVASGMIAGTSGTIPVSTNGARIGDLIMVWQGYDGSGQILSGSGWNFIDTNYDSGSYFTRISWKLITSLTNVTVNTGFAGCNGWAIYRGPKTLARVANIGGAVNITVPTPTSNCLVQLILAGRQSTSTTPPGPPAGYSLFGFVNSAPNLFAIAQMEKFRGLSGGSKAISGWAPLNSSFFLLALELRRS